MDAQWIDTRFRAVSKDDDLGKVLGWLRGENREPPVILDGKRPYAIVNLRPLMGRGIHHDTHLHKVATPVPVLDEDASTAQVLEAFDNSLAPYLPVRDGRGQTAGIVWARTVLLEARLEGPSAGDAAADVSALSPSHRIEDAAHAFAKDPVTHLPVVDAVGRLVGVLPRATVVSIAEYEDQGAGKKDFGGRRLDARTDETVADRMEAGWSECPAAATFEDAADVVAESGYAFITQDGHYRGFLAPVHMLRAAATHAVSA